MHSGMLPRRGKPIVGASEVGNEAKPIESHADQAICVQYDGFSEVTFLASGFESGALYFKESHRCRFPGFLSMPFV